MARQIAVVAGCVIAPSTVHADHHGMVMGPGGEASTFGASVAMVAAEYATMDFAGNYEGIVAAASWTMGRYGVAASLPSYRLVENGNQQYGIGDGVARGQVAIVDGAAVRAGVALAVSAPTGNDMIGFGMGHVMVMPAAWGTWRSGRLALLGSAGYSRALVDASSHHDHGAWPLVEPMNLSELTWSGGGEVAIGGGIRGGARLSGGVPVGVLPGHDRVVGAIRVAWASGRVDTGVELQAGLAGDPFIIRGVVETALRF